MFSGTKFRLWSRSPSKKDAEKESTKNKSKTTPLSKTEDDGCRQTRQDRSHLQKLQEDNARLEDTVEELTLYKTKAYALEKKLMYITKSFERKQNRYLTAIASFEAENEQLQEEMRRMKSICGSCYFCSRHQMTAHHPETAKHFQISQRTDHHSSSESLVSRKSLRRLQKLEEEQSAIVQETSRQKEETSRCLEQISSEVMKALLSQKVLRRDCTQLQSRIQELEKQNSQLNEAIFRQRLPYHSQTNFLTGQKNENVLTYCPQLQIHSPWDEHSLSSTSAVETIKYEEKTTSQQLFRYSPNQRGFGVEICRPTSDCLSYSNYIPEQFMVNSNSAETISTNQDCQIAPFHKDLSPVDNVTRNVKDSLGDLFLDIRNELKIAHNWDLSTGSTLTLRDETINGENDLQCKNSFSRGSTFSLNDILDGDIDQLQFSIQNQEGTKNDSAGNINNINRPGHVVEAVLPQKDSQQQDSKPLSFAGDTKNTRALQIAYDSCEKIFKEQKEPPQVPFSQASKHVESGIRLDNFSVDKHQTAAEKRHRYSYPAALPVKSVSNSEEHKLYCTQTDNSTGVEMAEASKALKTVTKTKQAVQKFQLWNFETFFDDSNAEMLGTIKERTVPVTESQPQKSKHEIRLGDAAADKAYAEKAVSENAEVSTSVEKDILQKDALQRSTSDENPENWNLMQESILEGRTSNRNPALQNLSQGILQQRNLLEETPPNMNTYISDENPLSQPHSSVLWANNMQVTQNERNPSEHNPFDASQAMHMIKLQDIANKQDSRSNYRDYNLEQVTWSEERKHGQNDIPAESVDRKAEMERIIDKRRERFDATPNENISKDLAKDVIMSKEKVMALTAYFEEVHVEQCPDCHHSGTRCRIASSYRHSLGSKDNSLSEDDSKQMDGNIVIDLDQNQIKFSHDDADKTLKACEKHDVHPNKKLMSPMSIRETSTCEAAVRDTLACDTSLQGTSHVILDDFRISENVLSSDISSDIAFKVSTDSRGSCSEATNSQIEGALLKGETEEINKTEPDQHNSISSVGESKSVTNKIENTDHKDLKICCLGGTNLTMSDEQQLVSKRIQWKSLPSVSLSTTSDSQPPFQVQYIRTLSLKSFSNAVTPPPSPKAHKENGERTKRFLGQAYGLPQENRQDMLNKTAQEPQQETQNQKDYQPQQSSQGNNKTLSEKQALDPTEKEEPQGCLQSYALVQCQGLSQAKQGTVLSDDQSEVKNSPQCSHLHSQIHSTSQEQFEVYSRNQSRFCAQNYPQDHLTEDLLYPRHHSPKTNPFPTDEAFKTQLQQVKGCPILSSAEIQSDDRQDDFTYNAYPDLLSSSRPKANIGRSQRSHNEVEGRCNVLTEEDIMKYRLDCHDSGRTTMGGYPRDHLSNIISPADMGSPGNSDGVMLSAKPPLPPRRFHVTKYYVRDGSNPLLDPNDFFNFENEVLGFLPDSPHADENPTRNEILTEANQRTTIWDRERKYTSHTRGVDFNYPGADYMRQSGEPNSIGLESATPCQSQLIENSKTDSHVSPSQGYQPVVSWQSSGKRNSYPDCSGKHYSQSQAWWDDKDIPVATSWNALHRDQTTRPASFHQTTESATYKHSFNSSPNAATVHRKLQTHCQQFESESCQKNSKDAENDLVFNEITKQIENLRQTVSELQKKSTEN